jgi:hypothetical protein
VTRHALQTCFWPLTSPRSSPRIAQPFPLTLLRASSACQCQFCLQRAVQIATIICSPCPGLRSCNSGGRCSRDHAALLCCFASSCQRAPRGTNHCLQRTTCYKYRACTLAGLVSCFCMNLCHQATVRLLSAETWPRRLTCLKKSLLIFACSARIVVLVAG